MSDVTREFVEGLPKIELHVHVESCISAEAIENLAAQLDVPMIRPKDRLFEYKSLTEFLEIYEWWVDLLRSTEIAEEVAYRAAEQMSSEGIVYAEVFTGPRYWSYVEDKPLIEALGRGFERAHRAGFTDCRLLPSISREQSSEWALGLVEWLAQARPNRVVGLGLDGNEANLGPTSHKFVKAYERAAEIGLGRTAHCGESSGPEGVWEGLNYLNLDRVDHGVRAIEDAELVRHLVEKQMPLTVCPTSNVITGLHKSIADGPIDALYRAGVPVTVNSDDPRSMKVTVNDDLMNMATVFGWNRGDLAKVTRNAISAAFCSAHEKVALNRRLDAYLDASAS